MPDTLDTTTVLVRAPSLTLHLRDAGTMDVDVDGELIEASALALVLIHEFANPRPIGEVLDHIAATGPQHFMEASSTILQFERRGILRRPGERGPAAVHGYVNPAIHIAMLDDVVRTKGFCDALRNHVRPEDTVVEIGVGTGVLSVCAALAGARHVYGIEASGIADLAERIIAANGVTDRVTVVRGRSTRVELPRRGDVLVTEMIGNDPLDESLLEVIADAKQRLLLPNARIIPSDIELWAVPVDVPTSVYESRVFTDERLDAYRAAYGVDFTPLAGHRISDTQSIMVKSNDVRTWPCVAPPIRLAKVDFTADFPVVLDVRARFTTDAAASHLGMILAFRSTLGEGIVLSTLPTEVDPHNHWRLPLWPAFGRLVVEPNTTLDLEYRYARDETVLRVT